jgi:hypothetical protein
MKTIALTLFAAAVGLAQSSSPQQTQAPATEKGAAATSAQDAKASSAKTKKPEQTPKPDAKAASQKAPDSKNKVPTQAKTLPAGAKEIEPGLYRYTDANGKNWIYRETPFGLSRGEEVASPAASSSASSSDSRPVVVTDLGDSYRFETKTPFGTSGWVRKKTELSAEEKTLVEQHPPQSNPANAVANTKLAGN